MVSSLYLLTFYTLKSQALWLVAMGNFLLEINNSEQKKKDREILKGKKDELRFMLSQLQNIIMSQRRVCMLYEMNFIIWYDSSWKIS